MQKSICKNDLKGRLNVMRFKSFVSILVFMMALPVFAGNKNPNFGSRRLSSLSTPEGKWETTKGRKSGLENYQPKKARLKSISLGLDTSRSIYDRVSHASPHE